MSQPLRALILVATESDALLLLRELKRQGSRSCTNGRRIPRR